MLRLFVLIVVAFAASFAAAADPPKFELKDGDRVVFLGNTLIEREQEYGYWELMLTMAWPERNVTFRNLGWSGDTVWGESRAGFGTQEDGFKALKEQVTEAEPTVIFVGYGNVEAFDGEQGVPKFIDGFNKLLDVLEATKARVVVLGPIVQIALVKNSPIVEQYNRSLNQYALAMKGVADKRHWFYVDLSTEYPRTSPIDGIFINSVLYTGNGMDRTGRGYSSFADRIADELRIPTLTPPGSGVVID